MIATSVCMTPKAPRQNVPRPPYIGVPAWMSSTAEKMSAGWMHIHAILPQTLDVAL